jgi:sulfur-carrier protein
VATLLLFAAAREAAGVRSTSVPGATVGEVLDAAVAQFGEHLGKVIAHSKVWLDGEETDRAAAVNAQSEVAVLPPVSGG